MNSREWDPVQTIGSDVHVLGEMVRHLQGADPKLVRGSLGQLRTAFIDLWVIIDKAEQARGKDWRDLLGDGTHLKTGH